MFKIESIKPFLKWPGNKYRILHILKPQVLANSVNCDTLVEPFLGSAAVFLNTNYKNYYLTDSNPDLINLYLYIIGDGEKFIKHCQKYFCVNNNTKERYYEIRHKFNNSLASQERSAIFLYLNKHGYNGLCRYNSTGGYNVPFGQYGSVSLPINEILLFQKKVATTNVKIDCLDFKDCFSNVKPKSVVYCDPPYVPLSDTASFTTYAKAGFNLTAQENLVSLVKGLQAQGITSLISNHDCEITRNLYKDAAITSFDVKRLISCQANNRQSAKELLAIYAAIKP